MSSIVPAARGSLAPAPRADSSYSLLHFFVYGLVAAAITLFSFASLKPWWFFRLYAPQYPRGLTLIISLKGFTGDAREIDMLNHYIGMAPLDTAASFERQYAPIAIVLMMLCLLVLARWAKPAWSWTLAALGAVLPVGFLLDCTYWLNRFGHDLDPRAPLRLPGFTPQLFGNGTIGQFMTFARPELGFWLAVLAVVLLVAASVLRARVQSPERAARPS